jgi:heterodisulfide reductase subunit A-like polyferredoxin
MVDVDSCTGCGTCLDVCQAGALSFDDKNDVATVNFGRCLGCGNCVTTCGPKAMSLVRRGKESIPPKNTEELTDIIMANKKGTLKKAKLAVRVMLKRRS